VGLVLNQSHFFQAIKILAIKIISRRESKEEARINLINFRINFEEAGMMNDGG